MGRGGVGAACARIRSVPPARPVLGLCIVRESRTTNERRGVNSATFHSPPLAVRTTDKLLQVALRGATHFVDATNENK